MFVRAALRHIFGKPDGSDWLYSGMFGVEPLTFDAPVYVTRDQALAYADWKGLSLPTEAQYHRATFGTPDQRSHFPARQWRWKP